MPVVGPYRQAIAQMVKLLIRKPPKQVRFKLAEHGTLDIVLA